MGLVLCLGVLTLDVLGGAARTVHAQASNAGPESIDGNAARAQTLFEQGTQLYRANDYAAAVPIFLEAARLGNAAAQLQVGWHYEFGKGVRRNPSEALRWYLAAARQGNSIAQCNAGTMYEKGMGDGENWMEAAHWYVQSAKQNDVGGLYNVGRAYEFGIGVPQNRSTAISLYRKAAAKGDSKAAFAYRNLRQIGGISFRTDQERQIFGLLPHNLPSDPAGRVFHNSRERLGYLKRERQANDAAQAWRTYDLDKHTYDEQKREYDQGSRGTRPTEQRRRRFRARGVDGVRNNAPARNFRHRMKTQKSGSPATKLGHNHRELKLEGLARALQAARPPAHYAPQQ
jgi:TPR repeat protein